MNRAILPVLFAVACCNAEEALKGPSLGFIYDETSASARPILGIAGSASFGPALPVSQKHAVISPDHRYIIGVTGDESAVSIRGLSETDEHLLAGSLAGAQRIVLSPKGSAAAVFYAGHVQFFAGLPGEPAVTGDFDVTGAISIAAVSDDGKLTLAAQTDSDAMALYALDSDGNSRRVAGGPQITGITFFAGSHEALFTTGPELYRLRESGELILAANVEKSSGVAVLSDGKRALVASRELNSISVVDMESGASTAAACSCSPIALLPMASTDIFQVTEGLDGPIWIVDASAANLRIAFVPKAGGRNE